MSDKLAAVKERMAEMIKWARAGNTKPLHIFVDVARESGATHQLTFDAFAEVVPGLELREFDALLDDLVDQGA